MPKVAFIRREVVNQLPKWQLLRDCIGGQTAVKAQGDKYLPRPNKEDTSPENKARYDAYLERAVFYNVTKRTLDGLVGQVFMRDPICKLPVALEILEEDTDGSGVGLDQQSKMTLAHVTTFGRCGLLVDYPDTNAPATKADLDAGFIRPTIVRFNPWDIINWRTMVVGAKVMLSLVVISEEFTTEDDGFEIKYEPQWRVLRIDKESGNYRVEIWRLTESSAAGQGPDRREWMIHKEYEPKGADGQPLKEIPFTFVGSVNNDSTVDQAPLYDLASLNIAHYRNSADYEESCFLVGQPTPFFAGLTEQWVNEVLKGQVQLGARGAVPLPAGGTAGLLQAQANSMPKEAMEAKERQMVALGAKLVEQKSVQRTFGEAQIEEASETAALSTIAHNVSEAYEFCLKWCAVFLGATEEDIEYQLSTDYPASRMSDVERAQLIKEWQAGAIAWEEMRNQLRKAGVATLDDEEARAAIDSESPGPNLLDPNAGGDPAVTGGMPGKMPPGMPAKGTPAKE